MTSPLPSRALPRAEIIRAIALFLNFFLIILGYYHIKPASRSLIVQYLGADQFPWIWITTAVVLGLLMVPYERLVERVSRLRLVQGSCLVFLLALVGFHAWLADPVPAAAVVFYVFVDIFSVVLVEQFWSLANTVYSTDAGRRWYGFIAAGGLVGGVTGGAMSASLLNATSMTTIDLLLVCAGILVLVILLSQVIALTGAYDHGARPGGAVPGGPASTRGWRALAASPYLRMIAAVLLCAQLCESLIEFQFIKTVEAAYTQLDQRTAYLGQFFSVLGLFSIGVNLLITPMVHRFLGTMAGLFAQPLAVMAAGGGFLAQQGLVAASAFKIADRGLSYSINRASKELLYIPVDPVLTYQAKAWIDMFGYRLFKVAGAALIIVLTQWLPVFEGLSVLTALTMTVAAAWLVLLWRLREQYANVLQAAPAPA